MASASSNVSGAAEDTKKKQCKWRECSTKIDFDTVEQVLEHVLQEHIPKVVKDEDGEDEVVCEWDLCEMGTIRGNLEKKTAWMRNHFKTRHAKNAKTFKCLIEGCHEIRATSQEIETHVRLTHLKKSESRSKEPSATPQPEEVEPKEPGLPRVWKITDGKVSWIEPPLVTKKTIVYYADGPRYVYPPGPRPPMSDESELASDEYWSTISYSDDDQIQHHPPRQFSSYHPVYNPKPWFTRNPNLTKEDEERMRNRPRRVKKKKVSRVNQKKERLNGILNKLANNAGKTREEIEMEKEPGWVGSFWHQYQEREKLKEAEFEKLRLQEAAEKAEREISMPPLLAEEPLVSPKRARILEKMPNLAHYDDENSADSESEDTVSEGEQESKVLKRKLRKFEKFEKEEEKPVQKQKKSQKKQEDSKRRPTRACRPNFSLHDIDEEYETTFEMELMKRSESPKKSMKKLVPVEIEMPIPAIPPISPRQRKLPKRLESPEAPAIYKSPIKSPNKSPKSPKSPKRPQRACRVLGSMEEVPFFMDIKVDFGNERSPRSKK